MAIDRPFLLALAALLGAWSRAAPLPVAALAAWLLIAHRRTLGPAGVALALLLGGGTALRQGAELARYQGELAAVEAALPRTARCAGQVQVASSPAIRGGQVVFTAVAVDLRCGAVALPPAVRVRLAAEPSDVGRGDVLRITAALSPRKGLHDRELGDGWVRLARGGAVLAGSAERLEVVTGGGGLGALVDRLRAHARRRIDATYLPEVRGMARALVLGEKDLSDEEDEAFRQSGLSHMLAVSGTHLVFAILSLVAALRAVLARVEALASRVDAARPAALFGAVAALAYADFAGGSGSAWRAAWMLTVVLGARALGGRASGARALAASLAVGVALDPLTAHDISFLLSAAATWGLLVLGRPAVRLAERLPWAVARWVGTSVAATLASMVPCAALLAWMSPSITLAGIAANVVAAPFGELAALPLCLLHTIVGWLPSLERGVAVTASGALLVVRRVAWISAAQAWSALPVPPPTAGQVAVLAVAALGGPAAGRGARGRAVVLVAAALALAVLEAQVTALGAPRGRLRVTFVDVGQGDAALVDLPDGRLMLVDGGGAAFGTFDPGERVLLPLLRRRRRAGVDVLVLSHPHPDHLQGLATVARAVPFDELWDTGPSGEGALLPEHAALVAAAAHRGARVPTLEALCSGPRRFGGATVRVVEPCPGVRPDASRHDNSLVLEVRFGAHRVLLTGDAERPLEQRLAAHLADDGAQALAPPSAVLKVAHHGSATSTTPELVAALRPALAVISCGRGNSHGHPSPAPLATLGAAGVAVARTDLLGSIQWRSDGARAVWLPTLAPGTLAPRGREPPAP